MEYNSASVSELEGENSKENAINRTHMYMLFFIVIVLDMIVFYCK